VLHNCLQYLDGPEVDCDLIFSEGVPVYGAITDNWPTVEPYFNETGSNCPSILPRKLLRLLLLLCKGLSLCRSVYVLQCIKLGFLVVLDAGLQVEAWNAVTCWGGCVGVI